VETASFLGWIMVAAGVISTVASARYLSSGRAIMTLIGATGVVMGLHIIARSTDHERLAQVFRLTWFIQAGVLVVWIAWKTWARLKRGGLNGRSR
jgi:uncharacterized membrane protein HdeD (DUF308 family)